MGARGRAKEPPELTVLRGNPGKRPVNNSRPKFQSEDEVPDAPVYLSTLAKKEWKRLAPELFRLGLLTIADYTSFAAYCENFARWVEAVKVIRAKGMTLRLTTKTGEEYEQPRPEVAIANSSMKLMKTFANEFGLTPSSRQDIAIEDLEHGEDPFAKFVRKVGRSG